MRLIAVVMFMSFSFLGLTQKGSDKKAEKVIAKAIEFHGGNAYENQEFEFVFRSGKYSFLHSDDGIYSYNSVKKNKQGQEAAVTLTNTFMEYTLDGKKTRLSEKQSDGIRNGLNSVVYFASLPYKLKDKSVIKKHTGRVDIKGVEYHEIEVRFEEEGGGDDFTDVFKYWVRKDNYKVDYLAYVYHTGKGGVRFREAFNDSRVGGVLFQDYNNYKAATSTSLEDLPQLFEAGKLKLLSKIETEDVKLVKQ